MDNGEEIENLYVYTLKLCALPLLLLSFLQFKKKLLLPLLKQPLNEKNNINMINSDDTS